MAEEARVEESETESKETETAEDYKKSPFYPLAKEWGYKDKEAFDTDSGKEFIDPETFVRNQKPVALSYKKSVERTHREIENLKKAFKELAEHNRTLGKLEREKALRDLKVERRKAIEESDTDKVEKFDEQIFELQKDTTETKDDNTVGKEAPEFQAWRKENPWYGDSSDPISETLTAYADFVASKNPNMPWDDVLELVDEKVAQRRKDLFQKESKQKVSKLGSGTPSGNSPKGKTYNDLNAEQKQICKTCITYGAYIPTGEAQTPENIAKAQQAYVDELVKMGAL